MATGKLNRKYFPIIWIALLVACLVRNAYTMYVGVVTTDAPISAISVFLLILRYLLSYGVVPMAVTALCAMIVWQISAYRYVRCIPRSDFCYLVMAGVAVVNFFVGIIEVFSILVPGISTITSTVLQFTLQTGMFIGLFFLIAKMYHFNPVEKYNAFKMWFMIYMIVLGIEVLYVNSIYLAAVDGGQFSQLFWEIMNEMGMMLFISELQLGSSVAAICIYFAYLIAVIVLGEVLRKQSDKFRNPETRGEYYQQFDNRGYRLRNDADSVFEEANSRADKRNDKDEKVFDEFDI